MSGLNTDICRTLLLRMPVTPPAVSSDFTPPELLATEFTLVLELLRDPGVLQISFHMEHSVY